MTTLQGIYTVRDTQQPYYWDVVFQWEDEFSKALHIPLIPVGKKYDLIYKPSLARKLLNRLNFYQAHDRFFFTPQNYYLAFHIGPPGAYSFHSRKDVIPIIIDFWRNEDLKRFESIFALSKVVYVTSREVFKYLLEKKITLPIAHLPLSLPDNILLADHPPQKEFDLIQVGRQNDTLTRYTKTLLQEFPNIDYIYSEKIDGKMFMFSTTKGKLGEFSSRESFLNLLSKTKISLLSGPGLDEDSSRTGGFSPVTPRFLESAACGCHLIGLYLNNEDFRYNEINTICENVTSYEHFRHLILRLLADKTIPDYKTFLEHHLTSKRAEKLKQHLSTL